jgi:hypothetical protein
MITKTRPFLENPLLRSFILLPFLALSSPLVHQSMQHTHVTPALSANQYG